MLVKPIAGKRARSVGRVLCGSAGPPKRLHEIPSMVGSWSAMFGSPFLLGGIARNEWFGGYEEYN